MTDDVINQPIEILRQPHEIHADAAQSLRSRLSTHYQQPVTDVARGPISTSSAPTNHPRFITRTTQGGSTMVHHPAIPTQSAASAHQDRFEVRESWIDRVVVLSACDAVDMLSAPQLTEAIGDALDKAPAGLIVDLTEVEFLASVGMSVLVAAQQEANAISARFGIVADGAATSRPIKLLGLDHILALYPTLDDALRDFR